ncbi:MAG TPA: phosphate signaling complex protein PhoU, partial [Polyangiaceae bacterium]|nr:phosphate signaling complex protein PhoU [Polyangiaceae bacterium]
MDRRHIDREYQGELEKLREQVLTMGARVEEMFDQALKALSTRNTLLARTTIANDRIIDQHELEIDERCLQILARRQPMASDLRFITTTLKLVTDLERVGDLCVNICERALEIGNELSPSAMQAVLRIAEFARGMLHDALDAFVSEDAAKAQAVIERDKVVDAHYAQLYPAQVAEMMADPNAIKLSTRLLSLGKYLERIADHATNISEMVVFMVKGEVVRHSS